MKGILRSDPVYSSFRNIGAAIPKCFTQRCTICYCEKAAGAA
jgi:hypothetical protein